MFTQKQLIETTPNLHKFALRLTRNGADADDLLQSTILRALEKQHLFETDSNLFSWTSKIMFNLFVSSYRRKMKFESQYDPQALLDSQSVEASQETICDLKQVRSTMAKLSPDHREILMLVCVREMRYEDVATMLGIPVGTVRSRLSRARDSLQSLLDNPRKGAHLHAYAAASSMQMAA